ncbi:MAG: phage tail protein [Nitrospiria bacterium]
MAETKAEQKTRYPLPVYNFRVTVDGTTVSFSEVSGIALEYEIITYKHGLSFWEGEGFKKYYYNKYIPVTLKKGTVKGTNLFFEWIQEKESSARAMEISLCDEGGVPVVSWRIGKAIPVKLQAPSFDANANDVAIESLEIRAAGITVVHH